MLIKQPRQICRQRTQICYRGRGRRVERGLVPWQAAPVVPEHGRRHAIRDGARKRQKRRKIVLMGSAMQYVKVRSAASSASVSVHLALMQLGDHPALHAPDTVARCS